MTAAEMASISWNVLVTSKLGLGKSLASTRSAWARPGAGRPVQGLAHSAVPRILALKVAEPPRLPSSSMVLAMCVGIGSPS